MMNYYKLFILLASIAVWYFFIKWYILLFILLSAPIILYGNIVKFRKAVVMIGYIIAVISVFLLLKLEAKGFILPVGYSVFAFSAISFIADKLQSKESVATLDTLCYLFFFPRILAGPLISFDYFYTQINTTYYMDKSKAYGIVKLIVFASFLKYVVADSLYSCNDDALEGVNTLLYTITYAIAFYCDFYAYSVYAITFGRLCGVELPVSFEMPYKSCSFKEFWSRWNITLGKWLKNYVYIPLGGSKNGSMRLLISIFAVFMISALWHNLAWTFIIWGIIHAILLTIEKSSSISPSRLYGIFVVIVCGLLWQLFRLSELAEIEQLLLTVTKWQPLNMHVFYLCIVGIAILLFIDSKRIRKLIYENDDSFNYIVQETSVLAIMAALTLLVPDNMGINFFYMRF